MCGKEGECTRRWLLRSRMDLKGNETLCGARHLGDRNGGRFRLGSGESVQPVRGG